MDKSQMNRAIIVLFSAICALLVAILYIALTKDDWFLFQIEHHILTAFLLIAFLFYGIGCVYYGKKIALERYEPDDDDYEE
jgi:hypothetical protein